VAVVKTVKNCSEHSPTFKDIKAWYEKHMHPSVIDFDDQLPYKVYSEGRWAGIFQCVDGETPVAMDDGTQKPIKLVEVGDEVRTYDEGMQQFVVSPVDRVYDQGERECVELEFDDGRKLVCTMDHQILTKNRGWIEAQYLTEDDELVDVT
jgi:hypothetical protein